MLLYGEGWNLGTALPEDQRAMTDNARLLPRIGFFNDRFRDCIKGPTFDHRQLGLAFGHIENLYEAMDLLAGSAGLNYGQTHKFYEPSQSINYIECHDNHTFWDRSRLACPTIDEEIVKKRQMLATAMVIFSQGIPFIHCGQEFFRTKKGIENSYQSSDEINGVDWQLMKANEHAVTLFQGWLKLRKSIAAFRFASSYLVKKHLTVTYVDNGLIEYRLKDVFAFTGYDEVLVLFNLKEYPLHYYRNVAGYRLLADERQVDVNGIRCIDEKLTITGISTYVLVS